MSDIFPHWTLRLNVDGTVELEDPDEEIQWSSDDDDSFQLNFGETVDEDELEAIVDYLELKGEFDDIFDDLQFEVVDE